MANIYANENLPAPVIDALLSRNHYGIVVCTFDLNYTALAQPIHDAIQTEQVMQGKLLRVNRPS